MTDEYLLWKYYGNLSVPLNYSAGLQKSVDENAPTPINGPLAYVDMDGDGKLSDDERDGDGDGLTNWDESHGRMLQGWWDKKYDGTVYPKETRYPNVFPEVSIFDPDSDGDGVKDGADDNDFDGLTNSFEVARPANWYIPGSPLAGIWGREYGDAFPFTDPMANPWARVHPYNPCKPVWSHTCHLHVPFGHYSDGEVWWGIDRADAGPLPVSPWDPVMYPDTIPPNAP
jgi:hypothetical protein